MYIQLFVQPGMVASIVYRDQELWSKGFGVTQTGPNGITPTKDTIYRIASVSKIFPVSRIITISQISHKLYLRVYLFNSTTINSTLLSLVTLVFLCFLCQVLLVYQLYERGFIRSLDDPLNNFCPHFSIDNPFTADNVTLRQIITSVSHENMNMIKSTNHNFLRCMHAARIASD